MLSKSIEGAQRLDSGTLILMHGYGLKEAQVMSDINLFFKSNQIKRFKNYLCAGGPDQYYPDHFRRK